MPIIGGGSNLLIEDKKTFAEVICLCEFNDYVEYSEDIVYVGAGVKQ